jgi:hypothetical protein
MGHVTAKLVQLKAIPAVNLVRQVSELMQLRAQPLATLLLIMPAHCALQINKFVYRLQEQQARVKFVLI